MARSTLLSRIPRRLSCMIRPIWSCALAMAKPTPFRGGVESIGRFSITVLRTMPLIAQDFGEFRARLLIGIVEAERRNRDEIRAHGPEIGVLRRLGAAPLDADPVIGLSLIHISEPTRR